jgi:outer membrane protein
MMELVVQFSVTMPFRTRVAILAFLLIAMMPAIIASAQESERYPLFETSNPNPKHDRGYEEFKPLPQFPPSSSTRPVPAGINVLATDPSAGAASDESSRLEIRPLPPTANVIPTRRQSNVSNVTVQRPRSDALGIPLNGFQTARGEMYGVMPTSEEPTENWAVSDGAERAELPGINVGFPSAASQPNGFDSPFAEEIQSSQPDLTWWKNQVNQPISVGNQSNPVDTNSLVFEALKNSPRIQAISQNPLIRELQVVEADADFDALSFVRTQFEDRNDPVGNTLTTGGAPFLEDHIWFGEFGLRKKMRTGASVELSERLGFHNSNSSFFVPQDQGTATLALNLSQPLLRGSGRYYNESQILIAQAAGGAAWDTFVNELQDELQEVAQSYWKLYYNRSIYLQKKKNVERGEEILDMLEGRSDLDSLPSQITRARSAVRSRRTDLANARRDVRDAATEIRRRIADRNWLENQQVEMLPVEPATVQPLGIDLQQVVFTALENRNEIKETLKRAKIAGIQERISVNELLPELSLLLGTYVSALQGESAIGQAIVDQFGEVRPGYSVGFEFEFPIKNRAARSRLSQRKLQLTKIRAEVDESIQNVIAESQVALRRVTSALETLEAAHQSIEAARADLDQNYGRWEAFALIEGDIADGQTPTTILDQLLDSQERLTAAELIYAQAELELKTAEIALQRTMGTLLMQRNVSFGKVQDCDQPRMIIEQQEQPLPTHESSDSLQTLPLQPPTNVLSQNAQTMDAATTAIDQDHDNDFRPDPYYTPEPSLSKANGENELAPDGQPDGGFETRVGSGFETRFD